MRPLQLHRLLVLLVFALTSCTIASDRVPGTSDGPGPVVPEDVGDGPDDGDVIDFDVPEVIEQRRLCTEIETHEEDPRVLLVIDRSGSMGESMTGEDLEKWSVLRNGVISLTEALGDTVAHGLVLFPSSNGDVCDQGQQVLGLATNNASQIATQLNLTTPNGGTPTGPTLDMVRDIAMPLINDGPLSIILATDGAPNCNETNVNPSCTCTDPDAPPGSCAPINCVDDVGTFGSLDALRMAGVKTFVVGVGVPPDVEPVIAQMATFGGAARATGTRWFDAPTQDDLLASLEDIAVRTMACRLATDVDLFALSSSALDDELRVRVDSGGNDADTDDLIPRDPNRIAGWDIVDDHAIELFGPACDRAADELIRIEICGP